LDALSQVDPQRAIALNAEISHMVSKFTQVLLGMLSQVPEPVKAKIQIAIDSTQIGSSNQNVNGENINGGTGNDAKFDRDNVNNDDENYYDDDNEHDDVDDVDDDDGNGHEDDDDGNEDDDFNDENERQ